MTTKTKRATIYFDPEMHKALRLKSAETETSMSDLVDEAIRLLLIEDAEEDLEEGELGPRREPPEQPAPGEGVELELEALGGARVRPRALRPGEGHAADRGAARGGGALRRISPDLTCPVVRLTSAMFLAGPARHGHLRDPLR